MIRYILFFFYYLFCISAFAQNIPEVKLKDGKTLKLSELHVKVNITGNVALTTYNMKFYNATSRILEGELAFPLGQGQSVIDFAMDVNGELRHAVIVEKELGRVAYENTIRQVIDPGLLEMTKGNNYKARIYPIPARGYKELEITYEQVLFANNDKHTYLLPLDFKKAIKGFSCEVIIHDKKGVRFINNRYYKSLKFTRDNNLRRAYFKSENFIPKESLKVEMQLDSNESLTTYNNYFNLYKSFQSKNKLKKKPKTITVFWDASYSMQYRKLKKELDFLNKYINYLKDVNIRLIVFNTQVREEKNFEIKNGNWFILRKEIQAVVYDGGTSYVNLDKYKSDEYLFFTDGMFNLGDFTEDKKASVYTINAVSSANHNRLSQIATKSGAHYVNLINQSVEIALESISSSSYQFLGIVKNENVYNIYPKKNTNITEDFSLSGKLKKNTSIKLLFGYNNKVEDTLRININRRNNNSLVKRLWAKQKLNNLNNDSEINKDEIIRLAKKYHLITPYTSMIILDRIEDYVRYKIDPPKNLKNRYKELIETEEFRVKQRQEEMEGRKVDLYEEYLGLFDWYNKDFSKIEKITKTEVNYVNSSSVTEGETVNQSNNSQNNIPIRNNLIENQRRLVDPNKRIVSGTIKDENNSPLTGAVIYVKGGDVNGTVADFDGNFEINAKVGDTLGTSYVGYVSKEIVLNEVNNIDVSLKEDVSSLDEIVVIGYGTQKRMEVTTSVTSIKVESVNQTLQGKVSGVNIQNVIGQPGNNGSIRIRGNTSIDKETMPLYIVDGIPYSKNAFKDISTDDIDNISVLEDGVGSSIYGSRAANGIIIITTKKGLKQNREAIVELNEKLDKEIEFKPWVSNAKYLDDLYNTKNVNDAYLKYLELRENYKNTPTFFIDIADYFDSINEKSLAIQIVSNLIEIDLDNHELIRALAYKLEYFKEYDLAVYVYEEVLKLRPEEPHSYRDLALAYEEIGAYQKAFGLLYKIIDGELLVKDENNRFYGIEQIAYIEACHLYTKYRDKLSINEAQQSHLKELKLDIRVVIDWNHNNTDLDLWVENSDAEKLFYKNKTSKKGGRISEDMTEGYGPEEFMIKNASKGDYEILVDYYADEIQKISGPTTLKVTIFTNYGKKNEIKEVRIMRLDKEEDEIEVGKVRI